MRLYKYNNLNSIKMSRRKIAVVGATGNVGREILNILAERNFPADEVVALASANSLGKKVSYGDKNLDVQVLDTYDFTGTKIGLFSPGGKISAIHAPRAAAQGSPASAGDSYPGGAGRQVGEVERRHEGQARRGRHRGGVGDEGFDDEVVLRQGAFPSLWILYRIPFATGGAGLWPSHRRWHHCRWRRSRPRLWASSSGISQR